MRKQSKWSLPGVLIFVLAAGTVVHAADSRPGIQKISAAELEQRTIVNRVDHGRQEVERKGDDLVRDANVKLAAGNYMEACDLYRIAKTDITKMSLLTVF